MSMQSAIYRGTVVHERVRPRRHRLRYSVFSMLLDLDELGELDRKLSLFAYNRWSPFAFHDNDHGPTTGEALRPWVENRLREAGLAPDGGPIRLLCYPRIFGFVFNPLSVYFCYRRDGNLDAILYEVCNTYRERHTYVIPVGADKRAVVRQSCDKALYVSPFSDMNGRYEFRIVPPGDGVNIVIRQEDAEGLLLAASFRGDRLPLTRRSLALCLARFPFMTLKIVAAIHWEAMRLWFKGLTVFPHTAAAAPVQTSVAAAGGGRAASPPPSLPSASDRACERQGKTSRPGIRERILDRICRRIRSGNLSVLFPSGARRSFGNTLSQPHAELEIHRPRFVNRMLLSGDLGIAESYVDGDWDTPDLTAVMMLGARNAAALAASLDGTWTTKAINRLRHARRANTREGSRRNIAAHYDLGNAFYRKWLDESMTYSSALFEDPSESLTAAQRRKYLRLAEMLDLKPGDRVLEIGCGWGGFAEIAAAEFGCRVVGITLSVEQAAYARERVAKAGLSNLVDIRIQDYRDLDGAYDKIVSIEMFEAVGQENWATYFGVLDRCLAPGGRAALQSITIADEKFDAYRRNPDFIQRYIFPGGMLPSPGGFQSAVAQSGFRIADARYFGRSYAETLRRWKADFESNWPAIESLGFDDRFRRLWRYYLCYCEVGFDTGQIDLGQFLIERE